MEVVGSPAGGNNPELARRIASQHSKGVLLGNCIDTCMYCDTPHQYINTVDTNTSFSSISNIERFTHVETSEDKNTFELHFSANVSSKYIKCNIVVFLNKFLPIHLLYLDT